MLSYHWSPEKNVPQRRLHWHLFTFGQVYCFLDETRFGLEHTQKASDLSCGFVVSWIDTIHIISYGNFILLKLIQVIQFDLVIPSLNFGIQLNRLFPMLKSLFNQTNTIFIHQIILYSYNFQVFCIHKQVYWIWHL